MALVDGSGTALGGSSASLLGSVIFHQGGVAAGTSSAVCAGGTIYLGTVRVLGTSSLEWDYFQDGEGVALGSSFASLDAVRVRTAKGVTLGTSFLKHVALLPILGLSYMSMHAEVLRSPLKAITMGPKTFRWMQLLQRGDLAIFLCNLGGGIVIPTVIVYSLINVRSDGTRKYIGPRHRSPVNGEQAGEFYAVGLAGQGGQPGPWVIEWKIQRSSSDPLQVVEMDFCVLDGVLAQDPRDITDRKVKFGWN